MKIDLFDYSLPNELIALNPPDKRDGGRLLVLNHDTGAVEHRLIVDLTDCLPAGALLVANDTRVIKARLRARRPTGGAVEVLLVREIDSGEKSCRWTALTQSNKPMKVGDVLEIGPIMAAVVEKRAAGEVEVEIDASGRALASYVEERGEVPLPPYIKRAPVPEDVERYQTVFAKLNGSVAAPTAGLHFTPELLDKLATKGVQTVFVTLHVGPGTFRPVKSDDTDEHEMDAEYYILGEETVSAINAAKVEGRPVIAIGTTVTRALEGAFAERGRLEACSGDTSLFITPGFEFKVIDGLFTNFHLPKSTLLCLVSALAGREKILAAYREAVELRYRFYSYGDAMLILPRKLLGG